MSFSTKFDALLQSKVAARAQGISTKYIRIVHAKSWMLFSLFDVLEVTIADDKQVLKGQHATASSTPRTMIRLAGLCCYRRPF
jgi:hypothetical protein